MNRKADRQPRLLASTAASAFFALTTACNEPPKEVPGIGEPVETEARTSPREGPADLPPPNETAPGQGTATGTTQTPPVLAELQEREAEAEFQTAGDVRLKGEAEFEETAQGLRVEVEVEGAPIGPKAVHVHEKGDCSDIPGKSMGSHFAPTGNPHGLPSAKEHHLGDLGNMQVEQDGEGSLTILVPRANLKDADPNSFLGKAIVIHRGKDKGTGTSGDSGTPMACGVIRPS
jgi:Cu-Zn family superoxide dismutase